MIERQNIRDEESEAGEEEAEIFYLQLAQCVVILTSLLAVYVPTYSSFMKTFFTDITDSKFHDFENEDVSFQFYPKNQV